VDVSHCQRTIRALNDSSAARELLVTLTTLLGGEPVIEPPGGFPASSIGNWNTRSSRHDLA